MNPISYAGYSKKKKKTCKSLPLISGGGTIMAIMWSWEPDHIDPHSRTKFLHVLVPAIREQ